MIGTDYTNVSEQLEVIGYKPESPVHKAVVSLFETLDAQSIKDTNTRDVVASVFSTLAKSGEDRPTRLSEWTEFRVGETIPGDTVRVRRDAYSGSGAKHNGLVGHIVGIRGGRVSVQYLGRSDGTGHSHHPDFLEVLVK